MNLPLLMAPRGDVRPPLVNEIFGPTFQGEGPSIGQLAMFVRLSTCNLTCVWCDTKQTWDWKNYDISAESRRIEIAAIAEQLLAHDTPLVVITGGEPLLQQPAVIELARLLTSAGRRVEIETNGTIAPTPELAELVSQFNVSPKLANSGVALDKRIVPQALAAFADPGRAIFKFVAAGPDDLDEIAGVVAEHGLRRVWVMPETTDTDTLLAKSRQLADPVLARGWNLGSRMHILLWGDVRGR